MTKIQTSMLLISIILISSFGFTSASADHIINPNTVHAIVTNPVAIFGKTYPLQVDNKTYPIYYGFNLTYATASNISLVKEHDSMQISLNGVKETDAMWIHIPQDVISADNNNFVVYVDGQEIKYELAISGHSTVMGFMVPTNAQLVEIQGTRIIPEFPISAVFAMIVGFMAIVFLKFTQTGRN